VVAACMRYPCSGDVVLSRSGTGPLKKRIVENTVGLGKMKVHLWDPLPRPREVVMLEGVVGDVSSAPGQTEPPTRPPGFSLFRPWLGVSIGRPLFARSEHHEGRCFQAVEATPCLQAPYRRVARRAPLLALGKSHGWPRASSGPPPRKSVGALAAARHMLRHRPSSRPPSFVHYPAERRCWLFAEPWTTLLFGIWAFPDDHGPCHGHDPCLGSGRRRWCQRFLLPPLIGCVSGPWAGHFVCRAS
jgi:hypothetical protein